MCSCPWFVTVHSVRNEKISIIDFTRAADCQYVYYDSLRNIAIILVMHM